MAKKESLFFLCNLEPREGKEAKDEADQEEQPDKKHLHVFLNSVSIFCLRFLAWSPPWEGWPPAPAATPGRTARRRSPASWTGALLGRPLCGRQY